jgi:hypothetical protein
MKVAVVKPQARHIHVPQVRYTLKLFLFRPFERAYEQFGPQFSVIFAT